MYLLDAYVHSFENIFYYDVNTFWINMEMIIKICNCWEF